MRIIVDRYISDERATLSRITVLTKNDRVAYRCFGCEDEYQAIKKPGETRIPAGIYNVGLRTTGGFHARYLRDRRVNDIHQGMAHIQDVEGFEWILIHIGNYESDTDGCLLVGAVVNEERMCVYRSLEAYRALYLTILKAMKKGNLKIEFQDNDLNPFATVSRNH